MFEIHNYSCFIFAILLFQLYPGPGTITILNATAQGGVRGGIKAVFGTLTGDFIYMLSAVLGIAALFAAYPAILEIAQSMGVIYLFWVGLRFLRMPMNESENRETKRNNWNFYKQALAVALTNPKAIIFFMAFFPLFLRVDSTPLTLVSLMAHVTIISLIYQSTLVVIGNAMIQRLSNFKYLRIIAARFAGLAIMCCGVKLILNKR